MPEFKFIPKQWVLVRTNADREWSLARFSHISKRYSEAPYRIVGGTCFKYCIPYEGNEKYLSTTEDYVKPFTPKNGDFLTYAFKSGGIFVAIYNKEEEEGFDRYHVDFKIKGAFDGLPHYDNAFENDYIDRRPSTQEEKQLLLNAIRKDGKDWDADKKMLVKYQWKPGYGQDYFTLDFEKCRGGFFVLKACWTNDFDDMYNEEHDIVFRTEEEAEKEAEKENKLFKE